MQLVGAGRQTFDSPDLMSVCLHSKHQTGTCRFAVKQNCACTTHAMLAANMSACQLQFMTQEIAEQKARLDLALIFLIINFHTDRNRLHHSSSPARWIARFKALLVRTLARCR